MLRIVVFVSFLTFSFTALQAQDLSGFWSGKLTQHTGDKIVDYTFTLSLEHNEGKITGKSYVAIDDIYAEESLEGYFDGKILKFQEKEILKQKVIPNLEWCIKNGLLELKYDKGTLRLEGWWKGVTSFGLCDDGEVFLEKKEDIAFLFPIPKN
ncbi:MAG: hypothetical protein AAF502_22985 [Bacteroidota bacterium]